MSDLMIPKATIEPVESYHLAARNPQQMEAARGGLQHWIVGKLDQLDAEILEIATARDEAKKHKWKISTFSSMLSKANVRKMFYQKVLDAVNAGFTIVPNFPIDVFAIRCDREHANGDDEYNFGRNADWRAEKPDLLEAGEGDYKSVKPDGNTRIEVITEKDGTKRNKHWFIPTKMQECEFPVSAAHPVVMSATAEAMTMRIFDRIGICPKTRRRGKGDPLIIGQIQMDNPKWGEPKVVSFLIAWYVDLRTL